jgi:hypothetical protein
MNRSVTIAQQLHAIVYDQNGRASVPTIDVGPEALDELTEAEPECGCPRHAGRVPVVARRRLRSRG